MNGKNHNLASVAVAAFAKTPGVTEAKTRLAAGIGRDHAASFYEKSIDCIRCWGAELEAIFAKLQFFIAVAETLKDAGSYWGEDKLIAQGTGGLADRLHRVYDELFSEFELVILTGMDSPQLNRSHWEEIQLELGKGCEFVIGPAEDGGFYALAGTKAIPKELWERVPYSDSNTSKVLVDALSAIGRVGIIRTLRDCDHAEDLPIVASQIASLACPSKAQVELKDWIYKTFEG